MPFIWFVPHWGGCKVAWRGQRTGVSVSRMRTIVAFMGGLLVALLVGLVPSEVISWLRDWAGRGGPDTPVDEERTGKPRRGPRRQRGRS